MPVPVEQPLDEIGWTGNPMEVGGIHNNSILYYFAKSPFYDKTSNNEVVFNQGLNNAAMFQFLATREMFEGRLKTMSGLEFIVAQEPAETNPGAGTGVWVVNKQTRRKRQNEDDEVIVHSSYYLIHDTWFMAPSLADVFSMRIAHIATSIKNILPKVSEVQTWSPATGTTFKKPVEKKDDKASSALNLGGASTASAPEVPATKKLQLLHSDPTEDVPPPWIFDDVLAIHERCGDQYMDENPITGTPGAFILSSTGRPKVNLATAPLQPGKGLPLGFGGAGPGAAGIAGKLPALNTKVAQVTDGPVSAKATKSPKTPGVGGPGKLKRRKSSKAVVGTPSS
ncbi:putative mediator of RNA polymerase II transcription subunit 6 [Podospora fimiseda]|uniref:Mediator of RNA polymerase II transcription subunit 6 n=1 Tax=Podospora fimiseda TaxID=252190 RepID=A0AAN7BVR2_9PEZI|nr:putative mediator of RNA polymerase II transcription subunit 6 [Podospora fimiseda]